MLSKITFDCFRKELLISTMSKNLGLHKKWQGQSRKFFLSWLSRSIAKYDLFSMKEKLAYHFRKYQNVFEKEGSCFCWRPKEKERSRLLLDRLDFESTSSKFSSAQKMDITQTRATGATENNESETMQDNTDVYKKFDWSRYQPASEEVLKRIQEREDELLKILPKKMADYYGLNNVDSTSMYVNTDES